MGRVTEKNLKILFVGQLAHGQTSRMRMEELKELGHTIIPLNSQSGWDAAPWLARRIQQKLHIGPVISQLNESVIKLTKQHRPDLLWAEKQEYLRPETIKYLNRNGTKVLHYTPDPYFTLKWKRTSLMDACMPLFDYAVTSKQYELNEYRRVCKKVIYMPLGYSEKCHRPVVPSQRNIRSMFSSDVAFLGGWEPRREALLNSVARTGCNLKIWGYSWDHIIDGRWTPRRALRLRLLSGDTSYKIVKNKRLGNALQGGELYGDAYAWALSGSRINVGFLRHVCPDQHTTRTFEIPACGSMLIADRTDEHQEFFEEGKEAEFFSTEEELVDKITFYLKNEDSREKLARNSYLRCQYSGYSYRRRLSEVMAEIN